MIIYTFARQALMPVSSQQICQFLSLFKQASEKELYVPNRDKNRDFLARHGFTIQDRKDVIAGLQLKNYAKGPEPDDKDPAGPKNIWVFGVQYEGIAIYIKLKLIEESNHVNRAIVISFHEAEYPMRFPYRK